MSAGKFEKYRTVWTTHVVVSRIVRGVYIFNNGDNTMPLKKPLPVLVPQRLRKVPGSFAWIDHRIRSEGILKRMQPADIGLYMFLTLAADRNGLSCWRLDRIEREEPCFDRHALWAARDRLIKFGMIAYRPWRKGDPDGCYQVLSVERPEDRLSPELKDAISKVFRKIETQHTGT